jgi:signal transduction histidine kinase
MGRWPDIALWGAAATVAANMVLLVVVWPRGDEPWAIGHLIILGAAILIRARRPELAVSAWSAFTVLAAALGELCNTTLSALLEGDAAAPPIAAATAIGLGAGALGVAATVTLLAVYPDDQPLVRWERQVLGAVWLLLILPVVVILGASEIPIPSYVADGADGADIANPFHILPFAISSGAVDGVVGFSVLSLLGGVAILVAHYRRADVGVRRQIRWLLVPFPVVVFAMALEAMLGESGQVVVWLLFVFLNPAIPLAWTIGILQPEGWDADKVLRRSLVYGILWIAIVGALVGTAAVAGTTVGRYVPVGWAIVIALVISLVFQPLRRRMESLAARWVFGERVDHSNVIANLGATLAQTFDLERLLPRMVTALEDGLQLTWARVALQGVADVDAPGEPELEVPIELDGEHLGVVECGAKRDGPWTDEDRAVVATFARQAALAVRNVRLTEQTARYAAAVEDSRSRIARAAESERRRIERNIHDGIQQDLVVLLATAGRIQDEPDPAVMSAGMVEIRRRLERVLGDLRDLARGIYPSVLSDQGILPAVEALVATHPHPVRLRADACLRQLRLPEEIEGAAYFTIAEALTNSLKHADARDVEVRLSRVNGTLMIEVADDGVGFDPTQPVGRGLEGLADRLGALGGTFAVDAAAGRGTVVHASLSTAHGTRS